MPSVLEIIFVKYKNKNKLYFADCDILSGFNLRPEFIAFRVNSEMDTVLMGVVATEDMGGHIVCSNFLMSI